MNRIISLSLLIASIILLFAEYGISTLSLPDNIIISKDNTGTRKSLTVYDSNCNKLSKIKKNCHSWNNDVIVYDASGKGTVQSTTDYRVRNDDVMMIYYGDHSDHALTLVFGVYDKIKAIFSFDNQINMLIFDPKITTGSMVSQYGKLVAIIDGNTFLTKTLTISDVNGTEIYAISDNAYNFQVNPCRSKNLLADSFYTIAGTDHGDSIVPKDLFIAMVSTLILNLASDNNKRDACTSWTLYGRWIFTALMGVVGLCLIGCFIQAFRKGYITQRIREKFTFLDVDKYPVRGRDDTNADLDEEERRRRESNASNQSIVSLEEEERRRRESNASNSSYS